MTQKQADTSEQNLSGCLAEGAAAERIVLTAIAQKNVTPDDLVDGLRSHSWSNPDHQVVFEALLALGNSPPALIREQIRATLTRKGFPDIDVGYLFEPLFQSSGILDEAIAALLPAKSRRQATGRLPHATDQPWGRHLSLIEVIALPVFVELYIWKLQFLSRSIWIVFPVWLVLSFLIHRDTPKTLGWRADNLWPATKQTVIAYGCMAAVLIGIGLFLGARTVPHHLIEPQRLWSYFAFCLLQQVALNSLVNNRLLSLTSKRWISSVLTGLIFAICHWPNPVLVPLTLIGGIVMAWLFARHRNIIPLAIGQAILGSIVAWSFPVAWQHHLRVGPGYYEQASVSSLTIPSTSSAKVAASIADWERKYLPSA
jgi:hypothetical protein